DLVQLSAEHRRIRAEQVLAPLARGEVDQALGVALGVQMQSYARQRALLASLSDQAHREAQRAEDNATRLLASTTAAALIAALLIVAVLTRLTATPLHQLALAADRIAEGDLNVPALQTGRADEVGVLSQAFTRMSTSLQAMVEVARRIAA